MDFTRAVKSLKKTFGDPINTKLLFFIGKLWAVCASISILSIYRRMAPFTRRSEPIRAATSFCTNLYELIELSLFGLARTLFYFDSLFCISIPCHLPSV